MQALRPAVRRHLLGRTTFNARPSYSFSKPIYRAQHNQYGPHKEYFQTPGQAPMPDMTPYQPGEPISTTHNSNEPSRFNRALRSISWLALFYVVGIAAGTALSTWEYMQPPNEPGSPEEQAILEEIDFMMKNNPIAEELRQQGCIQEEFYTRRPGAFGGSNLVHDTLRGSSQALNIQAFRNPKTNYTFIIFFVGFGMDGFPDVMHGGITATMMLEAAAKHFSYFWPGLKLKEGDPSISVNYRRPVKPGELYTIMIPPATIAPVKGEPGKKTLNCMAHLLRTDNAPIVNINYNMISGVAEHTVEIMSTVGTDPNMAQATIRAEIDAEVKTPQGEQTEEPATPAASDTKQFNSRDIRIVHGRSG